MLVFYSTMDQIRWIRRDINKRKILQREHIHQGERMLIKRMDLMFCPIAHAFNDRLDQIWIRGNDIKGTEQEMAGNGRPLLSPSRC